MYGNVQHNLPGLGWNSRCNLFSEMFPDLFNVQNSGYFQFFLVLKKLWQIFVVERKFETCLIEIIYAVKLAQNFDKKKTGQRLRPNLANVLSGHPPRKKNEELGIIPKESVIIYLALNLTATIINQG